VLTIRTGRRGGPVVSRPTAADFSGALKFILQFEHTSFQELFTARITVESAVARLAAERATEPEIAALQASVDALAADLDDASFGRLENARFHAAVARAGRNVALRFFVDATRVTSDETAAKLLYVRRRRSPHVTAHQQIVDAIAAHDPDAAEAAMRAHLEEAAQHLRSVSTQLLDEEIRWIG
jgi:DNA-binding FadR family transcriptional regulator